MDETEGRTASVMLGGDVMLGRMVGQHIGTHGAAYPLGGIAPLLRRADLTIVNLECAITASNRVWGGAPKAFYFGAPPEAVQSLLDAGVDGVSLANNHLLDFDIAGLEDTLSTLRLHGIGYTGAGRDIAEARAPVFFERNGIRFGMVSYCDHQADFAADDDRPGIAYLDLSGETAALDQFRAGLAQIRQGNVDWPILALHWGPNMVHRPSLYFMRLAHAAIDLGYRIIFGHSAHVFHGVELYRGCPIVYAAGDLVDDYYVDPDFRNDHQLLFELHLTRATLHRIRLHPVLIDECRVNSARGRSFDYIASRVTELCAAMGTQVRRSGEELWIDGPGCDEINGKFELRTTLLTVVK